MPKHMCYAHGKQAGPQENEKTGPETVIGFEEVFLFYKEEIKCWNDFSLDIKQENIITHIFLCQLSWENNFKNGYTHYKHKE